MKWLLALLFLVAFETSAWAQVVETEDSIELQCNGKPVLRYNKTTRTGPEGTEPYFARSGHIHPIFNPDGQEVTSEFPADHLHQHALFFAWTKCQFEGEKVEFWNQKLELGKVAHSKVISTTSDPEFSQFVVELSWKNQKSDTAILAETWTVRAYQTKADFFVFDIESIQKCATKSPLTIEKYHYGGMAIRGSDSWFEPDAKPETATAGFLTNEGKTRADGNHSRPKWVDIFGRIDGKPSGVAILAHPSNFRFPQHVRLHPSKPYFCFSPMVEESFQIKPDAPHVSRYRYVVHMGDPDSELNDAQWAAYAKK
ncbi:MAG: hypothetical protein ACI8UO_000383 [Verrucomicrobiales bacterium]|jgi:hypothetical protein